MGGREMIRPSTWMSRDKFQFPATRRHYNPPRAHSQYISAQYLLTTPGITKWKEM